jgi:hypothetical protein
MTTHLRPSSSRNLAFAHLHGMLDGIRAAQGAGA